LTQHGNRFYNAGVSEQNQQVVGKLTTSELGFQYKRI
jgi:hypothetical protein